MPEESSINVCIYAGGGDNEIECANIPIDATLPFCIISKRWVDHLGVKYNPAQKTSVTDATGAAHSIIGNVDLLWHRTSLTKSNPEKFLVVDSKTQLIKMRKNAISKGKEKEVDTVGLKKQTEGKLGRRRLSASCLIGPSQLTNSVFHRRKTSTRKEGRG